jgi:hypothetical protein
LHANLDDRDPLRICATQALAVISKAHNRLTWLQELAFKSFRSFNERRQEDFAATGKIHQKEGNTTIGASSSLDALSWSWAAQDGATAARTCVLRRNAAQRAASRGGTKRSRNRIDRSVSKTCIFSRKLAGNWSLWIQLLTFGYNQPSFDQNLPWPEHWL